jgi:hypothetical protein
LSISNPAGSWLHVASGFTNNGLIELSNSWLEVPSGTLTSAAGAELRTSGAGGVLNASLDNQGTVTANAPITISGQLIVPNAASATFTGNGSLLTVAGLDIDGATFDNVRLTSTGRTLAAFDNVTFQNMDVTATQLTISHPGAATAFTFDNVDFLTTPTTGLYLQANDTAADGNTLTINLTNPTPADGSASTAVSGAAVVNWL